MQAQDTTRAKRRPALTVQCEHCGQSFTIKASRHAIGKGRFCSLPCKRTHLGHRPWVHTTCHQCGAAVVTRQRTIDRFGHAFCSQTCVGASQDRTTPATCAQCGQPFMVKQSARHSQQLYCSLNCYHSHLPERTTRPLAERFWEKVQIADGCWLWTGAKSPLGYGMVALGGHHGGARSAHRVAWTLVHGPIPKGMNVLHRCDNPPCVNPDHLFLGTLKDNTQDMMAKGRHRYIIPKRHSSRRHHVTVTAGMV